MTATDVLKTVLLMFVAALVQISIVTPISIAGGHADLVLITLVSLALLRGPMLGAVAGFWAGLVLDFGAMQPLGLSSLVLTLAGYWTGRLGEATSRSSPHPPLIAAALATVWWAVGSVLLNFMLGQSVPAGELFGHVLLPTLALNMLIAYPVYRLTARIFRVDARERREPAVVG
jgi:rod shape-determining protein MreD